MFRIFCTVLHFRSEALAREFKQRGLEAVVVCTDRETRSAFEKFFPQMDWVCSHDIVAGKLPDELNAKLKVAPAELADIQALSVCEAMVLQMMERHNSDDLSIWQLRSLYLNYIAIWSALLDFHQPDAVLFNGTPHHAYDYVLYMLCKRRGIRTIMYELTYLDECLYIKEDCLETLNPTADEIDEALANEEIACDQNGSEAQLDKVNRRFNDLQILQAELSLTGLLKSLIPIRHLRELFTRIEPADRAATASRPLMVAHRWRETWGRLSIRKALQYYCKTCVQADLEQPFVYFPLHYQPERSTLPDGLWFSDLLHVLNCILASLPEGWRLYVKEHPRQFTNGALWKKVRSFEFYHRLHADPRVSLVPLDYPPKRLVKHARAVVTVTGTAGWEAIQVGTPAVIFGLPWYSNAPGVQRVTGPTDCRKLLAAIANGEIMVDPRRVAAFARVIKTRYSFKGLFAKEQLQHSKVSLQANCAAYAEAALRCLEGRSFNDDRPFVEMGNDCDSRIH